MRTKKILYTPGIVLAAILTTSTNVTETKAGVFGTYGNLKFEAYGDDTIAWYCAYSIKSNCSSLDHVGWEYECMYSLKSNCDRSQD